ncbi:hypothetical protein JCM13580A_10270 [Streptomyces drozdowiczii]|uniref:PepSY-associated TM helix domain-containing protein n=1 Tax=Streptomyces drozdowiczii TaxID=202862 RepID=UPI0031EF8526
MVKENTRSWPERHDTAAVDPATGKVTDRASWADYPLLSKMTSWGIDAHMGLLFGLSNQIFLAPHASLRFPDDPLLMHCRCAGATTTASADR